MVSVLACGPIGPGFETLLELTFFNVFSKFENKGSVWLAGRLSVGDMCLHFVCVCSVLLLA